MQSSWGKRLCTLLVLHLISYTVIFAQDPVYDSYANSDFPVPYFTSLSTQPDGKVILISWVGLVTFDGHVFEHFGLDQGMPNSEVDFYAHGSKGRFWTMTSKGLCFFKDNKFTTLDKINDQLNRFSGMRGLTVGKNDTVYIEASESFDSKKTIKIFNTTHGQWDTLMYVESNKLILRSQFNGEDIIGRLTILPDKPYNQGKKDFRWGSTVYFNDGSKYAFELNEGEPLRASYAFSYEDKGVFYTNKNIVVFDKDSVVLHDTVHQDISNVCLIGDELFVMPYGGGVVWYPNIRNPTVKRIIFDDYEKFNEIWGVTKDDFGGYWFLTAASDRALLYVRNINSYQIDRGNQIHESWISTINAIDGIPYVGHFDGSVGYITDSLKEIRMIGGTDLRAVRAVSDFADCGDSVLASVSYMIFSIDKKTMEAEGIYRISGNFNDFSKIAGDIYVGKNKNEVVKIGKDGIETFKLGSNQVISVGKFQTFGKDTILATMKGAFRYSEGEIVIYDSSKFSKQGVQLLKLDENGLYTFISYGTGLKLFKGEDTLTLNKSNGLTNGYVHHAYKAKDGKIWVSTASGLYEVLVDENLNLVSISEPLYVDNEIRGVFEFKDQIWAHDYDRVFTVQKLTEPDFDYPIELTDLIYVRDTLDSLLTIKDNRITIVYRETCFDKDRVFEFEYKLKGLSDEWVLTKERSVNFAGLQPGDYEFTVRVKGQENTTKPLRFIVPAPFWKTWWFMALVAIILILIVVTIFQTRLKRVMERNVLIEELNDLKNQSLSLQMNPHFIYNALNSIQLYILENEKRLANRYIAKFSLLMRRVLENSSNKVITLEKEIEALSLYMDLEALRFKNKMSYTIEQDEDLDTAGCYIPPLLLQPFVENAIWHGIMHKDSPGNLLIEFSNVGDNILCVIQDDGIGRKRSAEIKAQTNLKHKSKGMSITNKRMELANQLYSSNLELKIIDLKDDHGNVAGTRVELLVPCGKELIKV